MPIPIPGATATATPSPAIATSRIAAGGGGRALGMANGLLQPPLVVGLLAQQGLDARYVLPTALGVLVTAVLFRALARLPFVVLWWLARRRLVCVYQV